MQQRATIIGVKQFNGEVEGKHYDNCKVRVLMPVPPDSTTECGLNVIDMRYGRSENFAALSRMQFPFEAELTFELVIKNGRSDTALVKIQPMQAAKG